MEDQALSETCLKRKKRFPRAASLFDVYAKETEGDKDTRLIINIHRNEDRYAWALNTVGSYILRTNWNERDPHHPHHPLSPPILPFAWTCIKLEIIFHLTCRFAIIGYQNKFIDQRFRERRRLL